MTTRQEFARERPQLNRRYLYAARSSQERMVTGLRFATAYTCRESVIQLAVQTDVDGAVP